MEEQMARLMAALKQDPAALQALMRSPDAQALMRMLTADDRGAALQQAAACLKSGNLSGAQSAVAPIMEQAQAQALLRQLEQDRSQ